MSTKSPASAKPEPAARAATKPSPEKAVSEKRTAEKPTPEKSTPEKSAAEKPTAEKKVAAPKAGAAVSLKPAPKGAAPTVDALSDIKVEATTMLHPAIAEPESVLVAPPDARAAAPSKVDPIPAEPPRPAQPTPPEPRVSQHAATEPETEDDADGPEPAPVRMPVLSGKDESFAEGDYVVYPTHGVGKVEKIAVEDIAGHRLELIHITFEENRMTLRVPVAKARSAGLRKLATRKMFDDALGVLKGRARIKRTMWSRRAQEYEAKINSGDPMAIAEVVRDLHRNAGQPDQSFSERQIYEAAMDRLAAELAALDQTDKPTAATKLTDFLKTIA
jgi:CarD family transcriptional regulator